MTTHISEIERITKLETEFKNIDSKQDNVMNKLDKLDEKFDVLVKMQNDLSIAQVKQEDHLKDLLAAIENSMNVKIQSECKAFDDRMDELEKDLTKIEAAKGSFLIPLGLHTFVISVILGLVWKYVGLAEAIAKLQH